MSGGESAGRVLLIDDDELISKAFYEELISRGCVVDLALTPEEAERALSESAYALVLVDAYLTGQLSQRAGSLLDRVLALRQGAHVLVVTAYRAAALEEKLSAVPAVTIVDKPLPVWMLIELVMGFLAIRDARRANRSAR